MTPRAAASLRGLIPALLLAAAPVRAVELVLEAVTATTGNGETRLKVDSRARFDFDPGAGVLAGAGSFVAEYTLPNQLGRFTHKVEDLRAAVDGTVAMKSYECVEGVFGTQFLNANVCGNYRFGPNGLDEGGIGDDEVVGPPRSLAGWTAGGFDWDGAVLEFTLVPGAGGGNSLFNESALKLRFRVPAEAPAKSPPKGRGPPPVP